MNGCEPDRARTALVADVVSLATGIEPDEVLSERRLRPAAVRARHMAMYLANVVYGWPLQRVGQAFGRDRSTASHACGAIEDLRDDPGMDRLLDRLEACLRHAPGGDLFEQAGA